MDNLIRRMEERKEYLETAAGKLRDGTISEESFKEDILEILAATDEFGYYCMQPKESMPRDCRIIYVYEPSYMVMGIYTAILELNYYSEEIRRQILTNLENFSNSLGRWGIVVHGFDADINIENGTRLLKEGGYFEFVWANGEDDRFTGTFISMGILTKNVRDAIEDDGSFSGWGSNPEGLLRIFKNLESFHSNVELPCFVYGTLVKGGRLHSQMKESDYIGDYFIENHALYQASDWYPGIKSCKGEKTLGELYKLKGVTYEDLDAVEGSSFKKEAVIVINQDTGKKKLAYMYRFIEEGHYEKVNDDNIWREKRLKLYAYGSLMNSGSLEETIGNGNIKKVTKIGIGRLDGYRLAYTHYSRKWKGGVLDVVESKNSHVEGVVYEIPYELLSKVDRREGHPYCYRRKEIFVQIKEKKIRVYCYFVVNKNLEEYTPSEKYVRIVSDGKL